MLKREIDMAFKFKPRLFSRGNQIYNGFENDVLVNFGVLNHQNLLEITAVIHVIFCSAII